MPRFVAGTGFVTLDRIYTGVARQPFEALGGSCANVMVSLAMLGHRAAPIVSLGADDTGTLLFEEMERAGCVTECVFREPETQSPITVEFLDLDHARHSFTSICPETHRRLPTYLPLRAAEAAQAYATISGSSIFYVDRLVETTLAAMETAANAGALIFFEPNSIKDIELFREAVKFIDILKISQDVAGHVDPALLTGPACTITTKGRSGLTLRVAQRTFELPACEAPRVVDTCGSGDMVTTGLIHALMNANARHHTIEVKDVLSGLLMGQWLAALNCAFAGARGAFHAFGGPTIRTALSVEPFKMLDVTGTSPFQGYI